MPSAAPEAIVFLVIENLLVNAIRHRIGSAPIRITLANNYLMLQNQADTSQIPDDPLAPGVSGAQSTGLGLSIVDGLCRRSGWLLKCSVTADGLFTTEVFFTGDAATA